MSDQDKEWMRKQLVDGFTGPIHQLANAVMRMVDDAVQLNTPYAETTEERLSGLERAVVRIEAKLDKLTRE